MLKINNLNFKYNDVYILKDFNLEVTDGECVAICGPSGCGKSTLLRVISGLENVYSGNIIKKGIDITNLNCNKRKIGMLFQDYLLFPHMTALQNIEYGCTNDALKYLEMVQMLDKKDAYPHELSGGQQQRIALARVLANDPDIILLDEPFSNYDTNLKVSVRKEIKEILDKQNKTMILVTHDQEDCKALASRVVCLKQIIVK